MIRSSRVLALSLGVVGALATATLPGIAAVASPSPPGVDVPAADAHFETVFDGPAYHLTAFHGQPYFTARDAAHGWEIWRSDGTQQGSRLLKDVKRGKTNSYPTGLTSTRDFLFFFAKGRNGRTDLWRSDGTRAGTEVVKRDLVVDTYDVESIGVGRLLFFFAFDGQKLALWRSDGTPRGTFVVKRNFRPGWDPAGHADDDDDDEMVVFGKRLFLSADGDRHGTELWVSNGTTRGTRLVKDIFVSDRPNKGSWPSSLTVVGDRLFFAADDRVHARELWRSDGTEEGTAMVVDVPSDGFRDPGPGELTAVGQTLFFVNDRYEPSSLWRSDGTAAGTLRVATVDARDLSTIGEDLFFRSFAGGHTEVWKSDGTSEGTTEISDLHDQCVTATQCRYPYELTPIADALYVTVLSQDDGGNIGTGELWVADGSAGGIGRVEGLEPGLDPTYNRPIDIGGVAYLLAERDERQQVLKVVDGPAPSREG